MLRWTRRLFDEQTEMDTTGVVVWALIIYGGATALVVLYLLDTQTSLPGFLKGLCSLASGAAVGGLAASYRWARRASVAAIVLASMLWMIRALV